MVDKPVILIIGGIACFTASSALAAWCRPKADEAMARKRAELADSDAAIRPEIERAQIIFAGAKEYLPAIGAGALGCVCIITSHKLHIDKEVALFATYTASDKAYKAFREAVKDEVGDKKLENILDSAAEKQIRQKEVKDIVVLGDDQHLCLDCQSGQYFRASIKQIREAEYAVNKEMVTGSDSVVFLDTFYEALNLPTNAKIGEILGWDILAGDRLEIKLREAEASNGEPCWLLDYDVRALIMKDTYV